MKIRRILFLIFLFIVTFFVFTLISNVYAAENEEDKETVTIKVFNKPECNLKINKAIYDNYKYVLLLSNMGNYDVETYVVFSNYELFFNPLKGSIYATNEFYYKTFYFRNTNFKDISNLTESDFAHYTNPDAYLPNSFLVSGVLAKEGTVCHSSFDVYGHDGTNKGEVVFQAAPQEVGLVTMMKSINFLEVLRELLTILPIVLVMVIGLLALRKAIHLLFQVLRKV